MYVEKSATGKYLGKVYSSDYMYDFIEYLEADGVIFMTSTEYVDYSSVLH